MTRQSIVERLDAEVDDFARRTVLINSPWTKGRSRMFVMQHRQNTRFRNSVLKLKVATNCPIWDIKLDIIHACSQEIIADHEYGGGRPHWAILEDLGVRIGMDRDEIQAATPLPNTQLCWDAWTGLMSNTHWLLGLIGNTCSERVNVPGYGDGETRDKGWFGAVRYEWRDLWDLPDEDLGFFKIHTEADVEHSELGWRNVAKYAEEYNLVDEVVDHCRRNLVVWERYFNGIAEAGDALDG